VPEESHLVEPTHLLGENIGTQKTLIGGNFVFRVLFDFFDLLRVLCIFICCICLSHSRNKNRSRTLHAFESLIALYRNYSSFCHVSTAAIVNIFLNGMSILVKVRILF